MFTLDSALDFLQYDTFVKSSIVTLYNEEHRKYHNIDHIESMLALVDKNTPDLTTLLEGIIFHDVVYSNEIVAKGFNEAASVSLYSMLSAIKPESAALEIVDVYKVVQAINATAHHDLDQPMLNNTSKLLLDLDLHGFGLPWEKFMISDLKVRDEMEPLYGDGYAAGKMQFLTKLLMRNSIYYIRSEWEAQARDNIERLMSSLAVEQQLKKAS